MPELNLIIILFLFNSLEIFGVYAVTYYHADSVGVAEDSKMLLWKLRFYSELYLGEKWSKPLFTCPTCMASVHSLVIWIPIYIIMPFTVILIYSHIVYMLALAGFNRLVSSKFEI